MNTKMSEDQAAAVFREMVLRRMTHHSLLIEDMEELKLAIDDDEVIDAINKSLEMTQCELEYDEIMIAILDKQPIDKVALLKAGKEKRQAMRRILDKDEPPQ